jgi:hypothetical protein
MADQVVKPDQWIIVDDGFTPMPDYLKYCANINIKYVRREPKEGEGHTLTLNLKEAVKHIKGDKILIIEDDDWYGPNYIATMNHYLLHFDLVGEKCARYYHAPIMKFRRIANTAHASLCQTGFTSGALSFFKKCLEGDPYVDARIWAVPTLRKYLIEDIKDELHLHCSLKGLKGRKGIGTGHNPESRYYYPDIALENLIKWIGIDNAKLIMKHVGQSFESALLVGTTRSMGRVNQFLPKPPPQITNVRPRPAPPPIPKRIEPISVITCTSDRPECMALLKRWKDKQILQPTQWIVVDDGKTPITPTRDMEYYRRNPTPNDYTHTLCLNLLLALTKVKCDKIMIMEDDDWYHATYLDTMSQLLDKAELVGFGNLIFYYPSIGKYMEKQTVKQPAFSQTAFRASIIPRLNSICESAGKDYELAGKGLVDVKLWKEVFQTYDKIEKVRLTTSLKLSSGTILPAGQIFENNIPESIKMRARAKRGAEFVYDRKAKTVEKLIFRSPKIITMGMKGMVGKKGLTTAHNPDNRSFKHDPNYGLLKSILEEDAGAYVAI